MKEEYRLEIRLLRVTFDEGEPAEFSLPICSQESGLGSNLEYATMVFARAAATTSR